MRERKESRAGPGLLAKGVHLSPTLPEHKIFSIFLLQRVPKSYLRGMVTTVLI